MNLFQPKALACALLSDNGRFLFLVQKDRQGIERLTLPSALVGNEDPVAVLAELFQKQTGIDGQIHEVAKESRWNAGSRKKKRLIPVLAFKVTAKSARCVPGKGFSGFKWLSLDDAKAWKLDRKLEWIKQGK